MVNSPEEVAEWLRCWFQMGFYSHRTQVRIETDSPAQYSNILPFHKGRLLSSSTQVRIPRHRELVHKDHPRLVSLIAAMRHLVVCVGHYMRLAALDGYRKNFSLSRGLIKRMIGLE
jgi:hypothetical protein